MNKNQYSFPEIVILQGSVLESIVQKIDSLHERIDGLSNGKRQAEYLTAVEAMEVLKLSRSSFDELRARNEIKVIKRGRKIYVPASEVKRFFES